MSAWLNDFRYAVRALLKHRTFSVLALATLALAIGANTAIFSVARALLLDPLPYPKASQLVLLWEEMSYVGFPANLPAPGNYAGWKAENTVFQGMAAMRPRSYSLTGNGEPERLKAQQVTYDFFSVLDVPASLGRVFTEEEDRPDAAKVVVLSDQIWKTRFGARQDVVGTEALLDGVPHVIVGVMPAGFDFPAKGTQIWTPIAFTPEQLRNRASRVLQVVARLKPEVGGIN